jgi:transcriptional regulator with XRE-family HTH domain
VPTMDGWRKLNPELARKVEHLGENVRRLRLERELSQEGLAALIGVDRQTINRVEGAKYATDALTLLRLATALAAGSTDRLFKAPMPADPKGERYEYLTANMITALRRAAEYEALTVHKLDAEGARAYAREAVRAAVRNSAARPL